MPNAKIVNELIRKNNGVCLHSYEWAEAKKKEGVQIIWFLVDVKHAKAAFPIYVKKVLNIFRVGWVPFGLPHSGDSEYIKKQLKKFLRENRLIGLITLFHYSELKTFKEIPSWDIPYLKKEKTFLLNLEEKTEEEIFLNLNQTTRRNIKQAIKQGFSCSEIKKEELKTFWIEYEKLTSQKGFQPVCSYTFLNNLFDLCKHNNSNSLKLHALNIKKDNSIRGFLIGLQFGNHFLEFLRTNVSGFKSKGHEAKLLSWQMIQVAKKNNVHIYDFGGVDAQNNIGGYTYKKGFGGILVESSRYKFLPSSNFFVKH